jgi:hypothetical protein
MFTRAPYAEPLDMVIEPAPRVVLNWGDALKLGALACICTGVMLFMVKVFAL